MISVKSTSTYPTRYEAFDNPNTFFIQKDQTKHELAVIECPINNSDLEGMDGLYVEIHHHASRGIAIDCQARYPDLWRQQVNFYITDLPDIHVAVDCALMWYVYAFNCLNNKQITSLIEFSLWFREKVSELMSDLTDSQRAQLLQLYKSKLQSLGDEAFFDQFDSIRRECYDKIGINLEEMEALEKSKAAKQLGKHGGESTSESKSSAARENGKKGGRPKKVQSLDIEDI